MRWSTFLCWAFALHASAQHCAFDGASILVVRPHLPGDTTVLPGLRVTLLDSMNLPVVFDGIPWHLFRPNGDRADTRYDHRMDHQPHYPFARNNYILVVPRGWDASTMKVLIQDDRPSVYVDYHRLNMMHPFSMQVVPLTAHDLYPLCGKYGREVYPLLEGRPAYKPVDVPMYAR